jgi:hypothetical protein
MWQCVHCGHSQAPSHHHPALAAVAHRVAGYLLEAATLLPLFRMTMPETARPTWRESWIIFALLIGAASALSLLGARAQRRWPAGRWRRG